MNHASGRSCSRCKPALRAMPLVAGCVALVTLVQPLAADDGPALDTTLQRLSYMIGLQVGQSLQRQGLAEIDPAALAAALDDVYNAREPRLTVEEMRAAQAEFQAERDATQNRHAADNLAAGSGVPQVECAERWRRSDTGRAPVPDSARSRGPDADGRDRVVVHYRGRLLDGTEFDSSYGRGEPTEFMLGAVIPGWQAALQLMPVGSALGSMDSR